MAETEVFLELSTRSGSEEREAAWLAWSDKLSESALAGKLPGKVLRKVCEGIAGWIRETRDLRFTATIARMLRRAAPTVSAANGKNGLATALDTFGKAILERLEQDAGMGTVDPALEDLRSTLADLIEILLTQADPEVASEAMSLAIRVRTGPLMGHPVSREDVCFRLRLATIKPELADTLLLSLIAGFYLEDVLLRDDNTPAGRLTVGEGLAGLLGRSWPAELQHAVRAVVRIAPLSPFHLGGPTTRAHLLALDPANRQGSYLHDLKERVLSRAGSENLADVESVLRFWRTGSPSHLDTLASPESLTALPDEAKRNKIDHIRKVLEALCQHVPVPDKEGVRWLARMPDTYYEASTLSKVAGFAGCSSQALYLLEHLLNVYRSFVRKYLQEDRSGSLWEATPDELLRRCSKILDLRQEMRRRLFSDEVPRDLPATERLEIFDRDLRFVGETDRVFEELTSRSLRVLDRGKLGLAQAVLTRMLTNAALSGLGSAELLRIASAVSHEQTSEAELIRQLRKAAWLVVSVRNRLAERMQPHVEDSARRLLQNPLSRPTTTARGIFETHLGRGPSRLAAELGDAMVDDLLSADGGFLLLEDFIHRLLHLLEQY